MRGFMLALVIVSGIGCATAQKDTMVAELALGSALSIGYRTIDGIDKIKTDAIAQEILNGEKDKAKAEYSVYKPKIEKARDALNVGVDVLGDADKARVAASKSGTWADFNNWLPQLASAAAMIQQTIADLKAVLQ
jgi:hypothetical protein